MMRGLGLKPPITWGVKDCHTVQYISWNVGSYERNVTRNSSLLDLDVKEDRDIK